MGLINLRPDTSYVWPTDRLRHCLSVLSDVATPENITLNHFRDLLELYPQHVGAWVKELDLARFETIPAVCKSRRNQFLKKGEVVELAEWMYKRDSRRSKVQQRRNLELVNSNQENDVFEATMEAFREYSTYKDILHAIAYLESMVGVGIKMATLMLASAFPAEVPFFSHELFEWFYPEAEDQTKDVYLELCDRLRETMNRLCNDGGQVTTAEVDKVAFVAISSKYMQGW
ncbi:uncharacterized protein CCOS01_04010 [Colletotrichum costaricense]|uniref:Uncharacterized protein n=1 Tax=Colletotrichum costaricense TaxID=1209916 RepID=A0AAI9Z1X3_9PEZI|nr:uncharacterized protein CCOS01_04010 [Colletotrichum costaricense]KAK1532027.1 hypothetical protein CCOS01_04010 [Colletotrichum costaricense]